MTQQNLANDTPKSRETRQNHKDDTTLTQQQNDNNTKMTQQ